MVNDTCMVNDMVTDMENDMENDMVNDMVNAGLLIVNEIVDNG